MKYQNDIFISYSSKDSEQASKLFVILEQKGYSCWQDVHKIRIARKFIKEIEDGLMSCRYLFLWLTKNSVESKWVQRELDLVYAREKQENLTCIVPLRVDDCLIPSHFDYLQDRQYVNFQNDFEQGIGELIQFLYDEGSSVSINYCLENLSRQVEIEHSTKRLEEILLRSRDEGIFERMWDICMENPKMMLVDKCVYTMWYVTIKTGEPKLEDLFFILAEKSIKSKYEVIIDKFSYSMGQIAILSPNIGTRSRAIKFIQQKSKIKNNIVRGKYEYTLSRINEFLLGE
jgi:hypothetical protein